MEDIIECDFTSFKIFMFEVKWYMLRMNERDPKITIIKHANGFTMFNTRTLESGKKHAHIDLEEHMALYPVQVPLY